MAQAGNIVIVGKEFVFVYAYCKNGYLIDKATGKILSTFYLGHCCTRFTFSAPYLLGSNMDMIDTSDGNKLVSSGPPIDIRECMGAVVSNGRIFYTAQASGLQVSQVYGSEAVQKEKRIAN